MSGGDTRSLSDLIDERKEELDLSDRQVSQVLGMARPSLVRIRDGEAQKLDVLSALKVGQFLGVDGDRLLRVVAASMRPDDVRELERSRAASFMVQHFNLDKLRSIGLIESVADLDAARKRIERFLGLRSIFEYASTDDYALFSRVRRVFGDRMIEFWVKVAYKQFERINNPNPYDREALLEIVPQIRQYTKHRKYGLLTVLRALYLAGVTVIVQQYLPKTSVRGGTFLIDGKPCIVLTNRGNRYSALWFALMHELGHVILHLDKLESLRYHISGAADLMLVEEEADEFGRELLFPKAKLNFIRSHIDNKWMVESYAADADIDSSIIYDFHAFDLYKSGDRDAFRRAPFVSASEAVAALSSNPWQGESLDAEADRMRALLTDPTPTND